MGSRGSGTEALAAFDRKRRVTFVVDHFYIAIIALSAGASGSRWHPTEADPAASVRQLRPGRAWLAVILALLWGAATAQGVPAERTVPAERGPSGPVVQATAVARELGLLISEGGGALTLRGPAGILTLFDGSPDVVWQPAGASEPEEASLSAPPVRHGGHWWLPLDALSFFGLREVDGELLRAGGRPLALDFPAAPRGGGQGGELVDLGRGVVGLRLFAAGPAGAETQSILLVDAGLMGLAMPDQSRRFDELVAQAGNDRALILIVTALAEGPWDSALHFSQQGLQTEVRHPFRLRIVSGEAAGVGPDSPVLAVVLLPEGFNLRESIRVTWGQASSVITFRR